MTDKHDVEVVLLGNELLKGERKDAHLAFIGRAMLPLGVKVGLALVIGDDRAAISSCIRERVSRTRVIITTGGLGPTHDDVTREGVADGLGLPLEFDPKQWQDIQKVFQKFGRRAGDSNRRQAYFPRGATPAPNPWGTAPGFTIEHDGCLIAVLPGPPRELVPMLETSVIPLIAAVFKKEPLYVETFRTTGMGESTMTPHVQPIFDRHDAFDVSSLPHIGGVDIVITQKLSVVDRALVERQAREFEEQLRAYLGSKLYAKGDASLEAVVGRALADTGETLSVAESITGGLIGKRLTDVPGSSRYLLADVVAYSNESKVSLIGVSKKAISQHGAVSETVCRQMADGVRRKTGATWALATTGIGGPGGATPDKPVGLTYYGLTWQGGADIRKHVFPGERRDVRERAVFATLLLLHRRLVEGGGTQDS